MGARVQSQPVRIRVGRRIRIARGSPRVDGSDAAFLMLFGWFSADTRDTARVLESMAAALRVNQGEQVTFWTSGMVGIGVLERPVAHEQFSRDPARRADGCCLWMTGEAFDWPSHGGMRGAAESRTLAFRARLLEAITAEGPRAIADLDGEYQIALWSPKSRSLLLFNDRFAALPLYVAVSPCGTAFGGGVRGLLMAPGMTAEPDPQAIREAVTFGGYRLGGRTNVQNIEMTPPATVVHITRETVTAKRYWTWAELRDGDASDDRELLEQTRTLWSAAIARRLEGARSPGLTLSGGLDSRAIIGEASHQKQRLRAVTYGVPHADDVRIAERVARVGNAEWELFPLYADGWLDRRTERIHETDGLMDLVDLMHTEVLERLPSVFDVLLSGYIGDAVAGSSLYFTGAPAEFLNTIYEHSFGEREQDSPRVVLYSDPTFPDRTETLLTGNCDDLLKQLIVSLNSLCSHGVSRIVICCVTIHYLLPRLPENLRARITSLVDVVLAQLRRKQEKHLLICSTGARRLEIFQHHPHWKEAEDYIVWPDEDDQQSIHRLIYRVKANENTQELIPIIEALLAKYNVNSFVAGCTEIHVLARRLHQADSGSGRYGCLDPLTIIAEELAQKGI